MSLLRPFVTSLALLLCVSSAIAEELPWAMIWLDPDGTVQRQRLEKEDGLTWVIHKDGMHSLSRVAEREVAYRPFGSGAFTVYLEKRIDGRRRVVSNVIGFYRAPGKPAPRPRPAQGEGGERPRYRLWADERGVVNRPARIGEGDLTWVLIDEQGKRKSRNATDETQLVAWPAGAKLRVTLEGTDPDQPGKRVCVSNEVEIRAPSRGRPR